MIIYFSLYSTILTHKSASIKICFSLLKRFFRKYRFYLSFSFNYLNCRFFRTNFNYYNRFKRFFFEFICIIIIVEFDSIFQKDSSIVAICEYQSKIAVIASLSIKTKKKLMKKR